MSVQVDVNSLFVELVARQNVSCGETKQVIGSADMWTIACMLYDGANKEAAKQGIEEFLQRAWLATDISFFQKHGARHYEFWVKFRSDLF